MVVRRSNVLCSKRRVSIKAMETSVDAEPLQERANAHAVGLLQNPFSADGYSGAFLGLPHHHKTSGPPNPPPPAIGPVPQLDPFKDGGRWPEGCPLYPFGLVKDDLAPLSDSIRELVATDHPVLSKAAEHFFAERHGKRFRPTIVMLIGKATAPDPDNHKSGDAYEKQVGSPDRTHRARVQVRIVAVSVTSESAKSPFSNTGRKIWRQNARETHAGPAARGRSAEGGPASGRSASP